MEITDTKPRPVMVLCADALNVDVIRLLSTLYTVITESKEGKIIIELYPK